MGGDPSSDVTECSKPLWKKIARHAGHDVAEAAPVIGSNGAEAAAQVRATGARGN